MRRKEPAASVALLARHRHRIFQLAPGLLLVFKPRGHREAEHTHVHTQRLRVLHGRLVVRTARKVLTLGPHSRPLRLAAGRVHATYAAVDTWVVAESLRRQPD